MREREAGDNYKRGLIRTSETARGLSALVVPLGGQGGRMQAGSKGARAPTTEEVGGLSALSTLASIQHARKHTYKLKSPRASGVCVRAGSTGASMSDTRKHTRGSKRRTKDRKRTSSSKD